MTDSIPEQAEETPEAEHENQEHFTLLGKSILAVLILSLLGIGPFAANYMIANKKRPERKKVGERVTLVETMPVTSCREEIAIEAMGRIKAAKVVNLFPQVSGTVLDINPGFIPGGALELDEVILTIDPEDYRQLIKQRESDVARARSELDLEKGRQIVAQRDLELVRKTGGKGDESLILRKPQLAAAEAALAAAAAGLKSAQLNLKRTEVKAPFNCMVSIQDINKGASAGPGTRLGTLIGTDRFYVEALVPVADLRWLRIPAKGASDGSPAVIYYESGWGPGKSRKGRVISMVPDLEPQGRMARLLVAVDDPLCRKTENREQPVMINGAYVRIVFDGRAVENTICLPADVLHDGNRVWIASAEDRLEIRSVTVLHRTADSALIGEGLKPDERVITSDLSTPIPGMALRYPETDTGESKTSGSKQ